jgi:hypothetical protein
VCSYACMPGSNLREDWYFLKEDPGMNMMFMNYIEYFWKEILVYLSIYLSLYLSVKRSHHVRREGLQISTLIQKREKYTPLDFMKIWRSRLIQRIHKFGIKIRKSKEYVFNTDTINNK